MDGRRAGIALPVLASTFFLDFLLASCFSAPLVHRFLSGYFSLIQLLNNSQK